MLRTTAIVAALVLAAACGGGEDEVGAPTSASSTAGRTEDPPAAGVRHASCGEDAGNCTAVTGRVVLVEPVDPDGDGDAHYVLAGGDVTAPGISVVDVGRHLRPARLPRRGELVSAAGPVFTGSYGQRQIEAVEIHHQGR